MVFILGVYLLRVNVRAACHLDRCQRPVPGITARQLCARQRCAQVVVRHQCSILCLTQRLLALLISDTFPQGCQGCCSVAQFEPLGSRGQGRGGVLVFGEINSLRLALDYKKSRAGYVPCALILPLPSQGKFSQKDACFTLLLFLSHPLVLWQSSGRACDYYNREVLLSQILNALAVFMQRTFKFSCF